MRPGHYELLQVVSALGNLAGYRLGIKQADLDRIIAKGHQPHHEAVLKAERAEYLRAKAHAAHAALAELIEAAEWHAASHSATPLPTRVSRATRLHRALERARLLGDNA